VDLGVTDVNNMGGAMAPAAADSISRYLRDTGRRASDFDMILTGDLGKFGHEMMLEILKREGISGNNFFDCGALIYKNEQLKGLQGGSGAGCCSVTFAGYIFKKMQEGCIKKLLFAPTGALLSKCSALQGETIPSICHVVAIEV
jgi:stage V sporulation protein AD